VTLESVKNGITQMPESGKSDIARRREKPRSEAGGNSKNSAKRRGRSYLKLKRI